MQERPLLFRMALPVTIFLSAFLLFQSQPLVSRAILPWFGGGAGVWTICMLVFQCLLLVGYAYADYAARHFAPRTRFSIHILLLFVAAAALPILPDQAWKPATSDNPIPRIIITLVASVGVPFFVLSTTCPLLLSWVSSDSSKPGDARSLGRLYALSNAGSLLALLSYPIVYEAFLPMNWQAGLWTATFAGFCALFAYCAFEVTLEHELDKGPQKQWGVKAVRTEDRSRFMQASWFVFAFVPSAMLLAITNQVCLDIASAPFLWVVPLAIYLGSYVLTFNRRSSPNRLAWASTAVLAALAMSMGLVWDVVLPTLFQVILFFGGFFVVSTFCHGELACRQPTDSQATAFYLTIAAGGAAAAGFVAVAAPLWFTTYFEMHICLILTLALGIVILARTDVSKLRRKYAMNTFSAIAASLIFAIMGFDVVRDARYVIFVTRSFYGVLRVKEYDKQSELHSFALWHGRISHGDQYAEGQRSRIPTTYYGPTSGVGIALRNISDAEEQKFGVIGLGVGTLACYARPGDEMTFYEINPDVIKIAQNPDWFRYLSECSGKVEIKLGDARLLLEEDREKPRFDVLIVDAFSSDSIPTHLLTYEAFQIYLDRIGPHGLICVHVSNRHFDFDGVLAAHAKSFGLASKAIDSPAIIQLGQLESSWILLSPDKNVLDTPAFATYRTLANMTPVFWSDSRSSLFTILK